ncbi:threonine synthase [Candidatus Amarobacter glycogenicus]|uniref:threonine synthase n=1 Tax=Candidatus Amarobacter glycogenicus TaxID=3140699 RepID=UPI003134C464|nr:threonine synthase [Dehalococcoidia bacterium]MBK9546950.1 threonine synthase [Dehalococcoidia bacterium]
MRNPSPQVRGVLHKWGNVLPLTESTPRISLGEGDTPLVRSSALERECGLDELWFKLESCNPTGSFKDRGMVVAVAKAMESGARAIMCASTGNTSASAAAYAAHCGLDCFVLVPGGRVAAGKMAQAMAYGSRIIEVEGNFDDALNAARELTAKHPVALVNSVNPFRIQGQKTAAYEICESLGEAPDILAIPVGNAGNITAYWKGFGECAETGRATLHPRMFGFQAAGAAPLVSGKPVAEPETVATAIRIGNPASWAGAIGARDESQGLIEAVTDEEILEAYRLLARKEGLFVEPASAASVAGLLKHGRAGTMRGGRAVAILTGNGLKDPDTAVSQYRPDVTRASATLEGVERALGW